MEEFTILKQVPIKVTDNSVLSEFDDDAANYQIVMQLYDEIKSLRYENANLKVKLFNLEAKLDKLTKS